MRPFLITSQSDALIQSVANPCPAGGFPHPPVLVPRDLFIVLTAATSQTLFSFYLSLSGSVCSCPDFGGSISSYRVKVGSHCLIDDHTPCHCSQPWLCLWLPTPCSYLPKWWVKSPRPWCLLSMPCILRSPRWIQQAHRQQPGVVYKRTACSLSDSYCPSFSSYSSPGQALLFRAACLFTPPFENFIVIVRTWLVILGSFHGC